MPTLHCLSANAGSGGGGGGGGEGGEAPAGFSEHCSVLRLGYVRLG